MCFSFNSNKLKLIEYFEKENNIVKVKQIQNTLIEAIGMVIQINSNTIVMAGINPNKLYSFQ